MQHPVENLNQVNHSTLQSTLSSRNEEINLPYFQVQECTFENFVAFCEFHQPRFFRISTRKEDKINIVFGTSKKVAFFGRGKSFKEAFQKLLEDIYPNRVSL